MSDTNRKRTTRKKKTGDAETTRTSKEKRRGRGCCGAGLLFISARSVELRWSEIPGELQSLRAGNFLLMRESICREYLRKTL
jgi:hypothetical protein